MILLHALICIFDPSPRAFALPYSQRSSRYSMYSTSLKGDLTQLGLAGAQASVGDQFIGSLENPATIAMTSRSGGLQISGNTIQDGFTQNYSDKIKSYHYGAHVSEYPWGISAGVWSPQDEGDATFEHNAKEYRLGLSRVLKKHKLSFGASLLIAESTLRDGSEKSNSSAVGYAVGAVYQFRPKHLVGLSFTSPVTVSGSVQKTGINIPGFFQGAHSPLRIQAAYGWIPNRIFKVAAGVSVLGTSPNTALLTDQNARVGESWTLHPRAGAQVTLVDYKEFWARVGAGTYLEASRISGRQDRLHFTGSVEFTGWIFSLGWGLDSAKGYRNLIYSAGVDVVRLLQKMDLIPMPVQYPSQGVLPNPLKNSDEGLARPLVKEWVEPAEGKSVIEIGRELPGKVQEKVKALKTNVLEAVKPRPKQYDTAPAVQPKPKPKPKPKKTKKSKSL
ncbi:MAG: hypothetical protein JNL01_02745 [Bdellovibrionales bacterium]|nr:hypothetical protein [Bdellovibrionales bacterium]